MERLAFGFLISIDTDDRRGATSVYGEHEVIKIITRGAEACGYRVNAGWVDDNTLPEKRQYNVVIDIESKN